MFHFALLIVACEDFALFNNGAFRIRKAIIKETVRLSSNVFMSSIFVRENLQQTTYLYILVDVSAKAVFVLRILFRENTPYKCFSLAFCHLLLILLPP